MKFKIAKKCQNPFDEEKINCNLLVVEACNKIADGTGHTAERALIDTEILYPCDNYISRNYAGDYKEEWLMPSFRDALGCYRYPREGEERLWIRVYTRNPELRKYADLLGIIEFEADENENMIYIVDYKNTDENRKFIRIPFGTLD